MSDAPKKPVTVSQGEWDDLDLPEWTEEMFERAILFKEAHPEVYESWKREKTVQRPMKDRKS